MGSELQGAVCPGRRADDGNKMGDVCTQGGEHLCTPLEPWPQQAGSGLGREGYRKGCEMKLILLHSS